MSHEKKATRFLGNVTYTLVANFISLALGFLSVLILPRFLNVEDYGYYQLFIFYTGYVTILSFGLSEGVYLRLGGQDYSDIDKPLLRSQLRFLIVFEITVYALILLLILIFFGSTNEKVIFIYICVVAVIINMRFYLQNILQSVNRIKEYSISVIIERVISITLSLIAIIFGYRGFVLLIVFDILGRFISLTYVCFCCKEVLLGSGHPIARAVNDSKSDFSAGSKLMIATYASILTVGAIRFVVQSYWDIVVFAKISLTISIANLLLRCVNAVAIALFPTLRIMSRDRLVELYRYFSAFIGVLFFGVFVFYCPLSLILDWWLPQYHDSIRYAGILLPICLYESKSAMLVMTYYKVIREEKVLLKINVISFIVGICLALISTFVLDSINAIIFSILLVLVFRCILGEVWLSRLIPITVSKDIIVELIMTSIFVLLNFAFGAYGSLLFVICFSIYSVSKKQDLKKCLSLLRK